MSPEVVPMCVLLRLAAANGGDATINRSRLVLLTMLTEVEWGARGRRREGYSYKPYPDGSIGCTALTDDVVRDLPPGVELERYWTSEGAKTLRLRVVDREQLAEACARRGATSGLELHVDSVVAEYGQLDYTDLLLAADAYVSPDWVEASQPSTVDSPH